PELDRREMYLGTIAPRAALLEIDLRRAQNEGLSGRRARRVAQRRAHARQELPHAEGLGDVVVGAGIERLDLGALLVARGKHDDRHRGPLADVADELAA